MHRIVIIVKGKRRERRERGSEVRSGMSREDTGGLGRGGRGG